jgi:hypothetical protein
MHGTGLRYRIVERELQGQRVEISLIREMVPRHRFLHHRPELVDVIARKTFLAWDVVGQTTVRGRFEHAIDYAQRGRVRLLHPRGGPPGRRRPHAPHGAPAHG